MKSSENPFCLEAISEVELYKYAPWKLLFIIRMTPSYLVILIVVAFSLSITWQNFFRITFFSYHYLFLRLHCSHLIAHYLHAKKNLSFIPRIWSDISFALKTENIIMALKHIVQLRWNTRRLLEGITCNITRALLG